MKKVLKLLFLTLLFVFFACETEIQELEITNTENTTLLNKKTLKGGTLGEQNEEIARLENLMQWVSFLTAETLLDNPEAEIEFRQNISSVVNSNVAKRVSLSNLFSHDNPAFMDAFQQTYFAYSSNNWIHWDESCGRPRGGEPLPPPSGGCNEFCTFINAITNYYCLEMYLPNGYVTPLAGSNQSITSSAHPLNTDSYNDCFVHPGCDNDLTITPFNLASYPNALVVRPYVDSKNFCDYEQFNMNFTLFLNN
jgi:hypothetical protein